ncbi:MAG: DUF3592 domain-containing protein [Ruminococcus sp.]|nr:DUF3592 domain-containing protein [Ruminococcus sp.]
MKIKYNKVLAIVSAAVILFGAIFAAVGMILGVVRKNREKRCTYKLTATVCENVRSRDSDSKAVYPVYSYTYKGQQYRIRSSSGSYPPQFSVGEKVEMYIDPDDPKVFFVPDDKTTRTVSLVFTILGFVFAALGLFIPLAIAIARGRREAGSGEELVYVSNERSDGALDGDYISSVAEYNRYEDEDSRYD